MYVSIVSQTGSICLAEWYSCISFLCCSNFFWSRNIYFFLQCLYFILCTWINLRNGLLSVCCRRQHTISRHQTELLQITVLLAGKWVDENLRQSKNTFTVVKDHSVMCSVSGEIKDTIFICALLHLWIYWFFMYMVAIHMGVMPSHGLGHRQSLAHL